MPQDFTVKPANVGEAFLRGRSQTKSLRQQEAQTQLAEKKLTAFDEDRAAAKKASQAAATKEEQDNLLRMFGADAMQITESYGEGSKAALAAAQSKVKQYTDMYAETGDERYLQAADNLQAAVKGGVDNVIQMSGGVANAYMRRLGEDPEFLKPQSGQTTKEWSNPDVGVNPETNKPEYFITNQVTAETKWLGAGPEAAPDEVALARDKAQAAVEGRAAGEAAASKIPGTSEFAEAEKIKQGEIKAQQAAREARYDLVKMRDDAKELLTEVDAGSLGMSGFLKGWIPGGEAMTQRQLIEGFEERIALRQMQEMKRLSPTGATGFGQLSEKELNTLKHSLGVLNPNMKPEAFNKQVKRIMKHFDRAVRLMDLEYMEPVRREKGVVYEPEELKSMAKSFAMDAISAGFDQKEVIELLRKERLLEGIE
jgi:hypothetical protein